MHKLLLLVVSGFVAAGGVCPSWAQPLTLSGTVTDRVTAEPLSGAAVQVLPDGPGAVADSAGFYSLAVGAGHVRLRVSHLGYGPQTHALSVTADRTFDVALLPAPVGLGEVEVVAERAEGAVTSTQMSAVTLTAEEVKALPAFLGEPDVLKAVQLLPGVQSGSEGSTGLYVRGGGPDQNLILLDGAPVYNASHVFGFLSVFNADALDRVRLVKGGFPARYGGRLSSVVDVAMKEGDRERYRAEGTLGLVFSSLTAQGPLRKGKASFIASARRTYIDLLARPILNRQLPEGQRLTSYFYDTSAKLSAAPTPRDRLHLSLYLGRDVYGSQYETVDRSRTPAYRERTAGGADWGNATATLRWSHLFSEAVVAHVALIHSRYAFDVHTRLAQIEERKPPVEQAEAITYRSGIADWGGRIDVDVRPGPRHAVRVGGRLVRHAFNPGVSTLRLELSQTSGLDTTLTPRTFPFVGTEAYVYVEDDVEVGRRWRLNVGFHASALRVRGTTYGSLQPRLAARYLVRESWSLKASAGTMRQYLHLLSNTSLGLPTDLWLAATDRVGPQQAWQVAAGTAYAAAGFSFSLEGYYKRLDGLIEYASGAGFLSPGADWQDLVERGRGWSYGAEVLVRKARGRTTGWVGYTLAWSRRRFDALGGGAAFPYRYDRRHDVSLVLAHRLTGRLDVGATWVYGTGQAITLPEGRFLDGRLFDVGAFGGGRSLAELRAYGPRGGYRMAPYHRLDVVLRWHFGRVLFTGAGTSTLSAGAYNAYNRKNPFYLFTTRTREGVRQHKQASLFPVLPFVAYRFQF